MYFTLVIWCVVSVIYCAFSLNDVPITTAEKLAWQLTAHASYFDWHDSAFINATNTVADITQILSVIQNNYPHLQYDKYGVVLNHYTNELILDFDTTLWYKNTTTGIEPLDSLNAQYGLIDIDHYWHSSYFFEYRSGWINLHQLCHLYTDIDGINGCELVAFSLQMANTPTNICGGYIISISEKNDYGNWTIYYSKQMDTCKLVNTTICHVYNDTNQVICRKQNNTNRETTKATKMIEETTSGVKLIVIAIGLLALYCIVVGCVLIYGKKKTSLNNKIDTSPFTQIEGVSTLTNQIEDLQK